MLALLEHKNRFLGESYIKGIMSSFNENVNTTNFFWKERGDFIDQYKYSTFDKLCERHTSLMEEIETASRYR